MKDFKYKLIELKDSMDEAIKNVMSVIDQQEELYKVINVSDKKEFFENFINEMSKNTENLKNQATAMSKRLDYLENVLNNLNDDNREIIYELLLAIGFIKEDE